ncbi:MAG: methyltransferase, partial [Acidobacteriota bacterium]
GAGGGLLVAILMAYPEIEGILVDRPEAVEHARERLTADGLLDRCRLVAADLMETVPEGADVYIMKAVLHGCVDDDARQILANCRAVMAPESRLLIIEVVLPERIERADPELEGSLMADLNMLVATGGQERRLSQWRRLLESAGFELLQVTPVASGNAGVIEARPVSARKTS